MSKKLRDVSRDEEAALEAEVKEAVKAFRPWWKFWGW